MSMISRGIWGRILLIERRGEKKFCSGNYLNANLRARDSSPQNKLLWIIQQINKTTFSRHCLWNAFPRAPPGVPEQFMLRKTKKHTNNIKITFPGDERECFSANFMRHAIQLKLFRFPPFAALPSGWAIKRHSTAPNKRLLKVSSSPVSSHNDSSSKKDRKAAARLKCA